MIKDIETMEAIVTTHSQHLSWNGWDVVEIKPSKTAMYRTDGAFINDKWYTKKVYTYGKNGWEIPKKYVR